MITSTANAQVKELARLMKKGRARNEARVFIVEGPRMAGELFRDPDWRGRIAKVYLSESYAVKNGKEREELERTVKMEILSDAVFAHVSATKTPQGILAVVRRRTYEMADVLGPDPAHAHVLVLDDLQDPGNLGTIFRTAEAAGVTGLILSSGCVDIYNPKTVRSTMGAVLRMPFLQVEDVAGTIIELKKAGIRTYAAHLGGDRIYVEADYSSGCAFLIGNEGNGLRPEVAECADQRIIIPMQGQAESLNAAVAASVLMFEVSRQRRRYPGEV